MSAKEAKGMRNFKLLNFILSGIQIEHTVTFCGENMWVKLLPVIAIFFSFALIVDPTVLLARHL